MDSTTDIIIKKRYKPLCGMKKNGGGGGNWGGCGKIRGQGKIFSWWKNTNVFVCMIILFNTLSNLDNSISRL